jgi:predicted nucleic acid-binding Zn ribbon protein
MAHVLEGLTSDLVPRSTLARVQVCWAAAVGEAIAAATRPIAEREGVLTVHCATSVWAQELDLMAPELLSRLNAALGDPPLHKLRCRTG